MPRNIDHDRRREDIIAAAWRLIAERGLKAATMRELAAEAGFANGALKHYFPGKDEIITGVFQYALSQITAEAKAAETGQSALERLRASCLATVPRDPAGVAAAGVLLSFWERGQSNAELRALYEGHLANWRRDLLELMAAARAAGAVVTDTADAAIVDEIITLTIGVTLLSVVAPAADGPARADVTLNALFDRITRSGTPARQGAGHSRT
jgi:AcrR family transcriptional regulator